MPWTIFHESLTTWRGDGRGDRAAFADYLARRHDITRREAEEAIEDWAAMSRRRAPALSP